MKKILLSLLVVFAIGVMSEAVAQGGKVDVRILQTDEVISDSVWAEDPVTEEDTLFAVVSVPLSSDDAEEINAVLGGGPEIDDLNDDDLDVGWEGEPDDLNIATIGLRFQNIDIPQGETIDEAYIEVVSHEVKYADDTAKITITAEATDSAVTFDEVNLISARTKTTASVYWEVTEEWGLWTTEKTPDLSTIVQEIVERPGWESGNAIAFIWEGEQQSQTEDYENSREFEAFENISDPEEGGDGQNHPERVPRLVIKWGGYVSVQPAAVAENNFKLYPNPSNGMVTLSLKNSGANIKVYDIAGKLMKELNMNNNVTTVDLSELNQGVYVVKAILDGNVHTRQLIIE